MVPPLEELAITETTVIETTDQPTEEIGDEQLDEFRESLGSPVRDWGELLTRGEDDEDEDFDDEHEKGI
jgi:hypothetical protein